MLLSCHMADVMKSLLPGASCVPRMCPPHASGTQASHGMAPAVMRWLSRMRLTKRLNLFLPHQADQVSGCHWASHQQRRTPCQQRHARRWSKRCGGTWTTRWAPTSWRSRWTRRGRPRCRSPARPSSARTLPLPSTGCALLPSPERLMLRPRPSALSCIPVLKH